MHALMCFNSVLHFVKLFTHMWYVPVVADLCYRYGSSGTPTAEKGQVCGVCSVPSYININKVFIESIQGSCDITLFEVKDNFKTMTTVTQYIIAIHAWKQVSY